MLPPGLLDPTNLKFRVAVASYRALAATDIGHFRSPRVKGTDTQRMFASQVSLPGCRFSPHLIVGLSPLLRVYGNTFMLPQRANMDFSNAPGDSRPLKYRICAFDSLHGSNQARLTSPLAKVYLPLGELWEL